MTLFSTKHAHITLMILCVVKQGASFSCPSLNCVTFSSRRPSSPNQLSHVSLVDGYTFKFHSQDARSTVQHLILVIQSYYDDGTRYTAALLLYQLITQVKWSLDRAGGFSLITKLDRKHKKYSVAIINHPQDEPILSFDSIAWIYDHASPHIYTITTHTLTTIQTTPNSVEDITSTTT